MKKLKILMLEDSQLDAELIKKEMIEHKIDFTSKLVETEEDFIKAIHEFKPDIILSDYSLPQFTGFEALEIAKKLIPDIPFIIITGSLTEEMAADSIKKGAWNYIIKENLLRLSPAIENALKLKKERDDSIQAKKELQKSEEKFRAISESAIDSIFVKDINLKYIHVNPAMEKLFGLPASKLIGKTDSELFGEEAGKHVMESDKQVLKGKIVEEFPTKPVDGVMHSFSTIKVPLKNSEGEITGLCGIARDITERKQTEKALEESEINYRLLFNILPYSAEILDLKGNILDCNPSTLEMLGYKRNEIVGKNITEFTDVKTVDFFNKHFSQAIKGTIRNNKAHVIHKNGNIIHILRTVSPIISADSKVKKLLALNVDITELKKAEEALKNSEERLNILFEFAPDAYYLNDFTGKFIDGNKAAEKLIGYPREKLIGKNFMEIGALYPNQAEKALDVLKRNINGESTGPDEYTLNRKDGSKIEVEILTHPVVINNEGMVLALARDITERKQAEKKLQSKMKQLILINDITINRELTLNETRKEVNELLRKLGKEEKYKTIG